MTTWKRVVLVPVDDRALSHGAIRVATTIAWALEVPVQLVAVVSPGSEALATRLELEALSAVIADRARPPLVLRSNDVACALVEESIRQRALLCMSTHARSALGALVLGSTTAEVAARSTDPVVLVGPRALPMDRLETIVVATPPDERAERAVDVALQLATPAGSELRLVRVEAEVADPDTIVTSSASMSSLVDRCTERSVAVRRDVVASADVAGALTWQVDDAHADLIVLTARRHPTFERLLGGDVVREVVHRATCPVLVVPTGADSGGEL
jgi:nucleotide-binding universal stress UspA family protein